ncbi:MAG: hypothetical protein E6423_09890 [Clostridium sp.]|uniref:hypothetical protein n=1 Tax=Clostridium TaxID=1485 RepID=UPI000C0831DB|nr:MULTISPECIES: hypothetical protein [Clostridium]MDU2108869.1 hypothetical protein [Clostridium sp.]MDU3355710.1 hypothetical protein [Clostridium sp.]MDU5211282.1 hypothetical protein [Clostridium sp.]MDU6763155.1 hypothetical protein [Clostridium sp.]MDU6809089.1 hypothetical protein [Clostridium sp.]
MEVFSNVIMTILRAAQGLGIAGATYCFLRVAFKCFWCKESFKDSKNDALAGCIGLVVLLGADKIAAWLQSMINF